MNLKYITSVILLISIPSQLIYADISLDSSTVDVPIDVMSEMYSVMNVSQEPDSSVTVPTEIVTEIVSEIVPTETVTEIVSEIVPTETVTEIVSEIVPTEEILAEENPESDMTLHSFDLTGDPSGLAVYNMLSGELVFTTYLEQNTYEVADDAFGHNGDYMIFRTTDQNWCANLTLEQCAATSTIQTTVNITSIIEDENYIPEKSEIISAEMMPDDFGREGLGDPSIIPDSVPEEIVIDTPEDIIDSEVQTQATVTSSDVVAEQIPEPILPPVENGIDPSIDGAITKKETDESL